MSLATPSSVEKLQRALQAKAKAGPECRFHQLYDKLYREDVLTHAYAFVPQSSRRGGCGWRGLRSDRIVRCAGMARGTDAGSETEDLPAGAGQASVDTETGRIVASVGGSLHS